MTTKTITTYYNGIYPLAPMVGELDITKTGGVGGGVYTGHFATISNAGTIHNAATIGVSIGILFGRASGGGVVVNQAGGYIGATQDGVFSDSTLTLSNYGTIRGPETAIEANAGGSIVNGNYAYPGATIAGGQIVLKGAPSTISNLGTIDAFIYMNKGGVVTNGGVLDTTALMNGGGGIYIAGAAGTIANFGTIQSYGSPGHNGINLGAGGRVTNGAASDTVARITGFTGVLLAASGTVTNFGVIDGAGVSHGADGVALGTGGVVINGTGLDQGALIEGYSGVYGGSAAGTVTNWGTILGEGAAETEHGVYLKAGGSVINGGGRDRAATIEGGGGVAIFAGAGSVTNFGTILATAPAGVGVSISDGSLTNGSLNNGRARIEGYSGAVLTGTVVSSNFGTISGYGDAGGSGVSLGDGANLVNGAAGHVGATIEGFTGVSAVGTVNTVTNFGVISGAGGFALTLGSSLDTLIVEASCSFDGQVLGGGGTLDLDTGTGTVSGLFSSGGVTVSGSMAPTTFQNFATVAIGAAANFSTSGAVTLAAGQEVTDAGVLTLGTATTTVVNAGLIETTGSGSLTIKGPLSNTGVVEADGGTLVVKGAVTGSGSADIGGGLLDLASAFTQNVTFTGATGTLELAQSQTYTGTITGFSKSGGTLLDLLDIAFGGGTTASYSGNKKSGTLTVTDGTHTAHIALKGNYLSSTFVVASDGLGGTIVHDPSKAAPIVPPPHAFIAAMACWEGGGGAALEARAGWARSPPALLAPRMHWT